MFEKTLSDLVRGIRAHRGSEVGETDSYTSYTMHYTSYVMTNSIVLFTSCSLVLPCPSFSLTPPTLIGTVYLTMYV